MKRLVVLLFSLLSVFTAFGEVMVVYSKDGSTHKFKISDINAMGFAGAMKATPAVLKLPLTNDIIADSRNNRFILTVSHTAPVAIQIFSSRGRIIKSFHYPDKTPGRYIIPLSSGYNKTITGVYFIKASIGSKTVISKFIRM